MFLENFLNKFVFLENILLYLFSQQEQIELMDKPTKKKNIYNAEILNRIKEKYGLSKRFITMSLSGDRASEMTDKVKADYKIMQEAITALLKTL
jgi:hypothetical protein